MSSLHKKQYFLKSNSGVDRVTDGLDVNGEDYTSSTNNRQNQFFIDNVFCM